MYNLDFFTQYGQFYILNSTAISNTDSMDFWSDAAIYERLAVEENTLGVLVENDFSTVKGELVVLDFPKEELDSAADHIVEGSLKITTGFIEIQDCPSSIVILSIPIENNDYRVRVLSYNLNDPYGEDPRSPKDRYRIEIWQAALSERTVLKQWVASY